MTYNDNNVPYGSQVCTVGVTGYVAETIAFEAPSQIVERRDEVGNPSGQVIIPQFETGTAVFQLATTVTVVPTIGATFTATKNNGVTTGLVVAQVGEPFAQFDIRKVNLALRRRYGS